MSDNIPFEIQAEIIKKLNVKSLLRFRSVSKLWKSLISSPGFIANYNHTQQQQRLLLQYTDPQVLPYCSQNKYVSIVDDETFPQHKFYLTVPVSVKLMFRPKAGCSLGLYCLYNFYATNTRSDTVVLWNPSIRKSVSIVVPHVLNWPYVTIVGFGVCPKTCDPKLVKITFIDSPCHFDRLTSIPWQVEVCTLSLRDWRNPLSSNLPSLSIAFKRDQVVIGGYIYWLAVDRINVDTQDRINVDTEDDIELQCRNLIMSFDITSEEFIQVSLPDHLAHDDGMCWSISQLKESLVVLEYTFEAGRLGFIVWMMEHGVPKSFTKLFVINPPDVSIKDVVGFRESGEPLTVVQDGGVVKLFVYDPSSKYIKNIGGSGYKNLWFASSYRETLLLLNH